jgi:hypothetical protein
MTIKTAYEVYHYRTYATYNKVANKAFAYVYVSNFCDQNATQSKEEDEYRAKSDCNILYVNALSSKGKSKVVPVLLFLTEHHAMKGRGCRAPCILNLGTRWR